MSALFASGHIVDFILALTALEAMAILIHHRRTGCGPAPADLLPTLLSGAGLLLALRCALAGTSWHWIALWLLGALVAHLADLRQLWK